MDAKYSWNVPSLATIIVVTWFILSNVDTLTSASVDVAHNHALICRIYDDFQALPNGVLRDSSLGEMSTYPRGSHIAAAIVGRVLGSPFLGMRFVSLLAVSVSWVCAIRLSGFGLKQHEKCLSMGLLGGIVAVNNVSFDFLLLGYEISDVFFFAQASAHAVMLASFTVVVEMNRAKVPRLDKRMFLLKALFIVSSIHLLPAVILLGYSLLSTFHETILVSKATKKSIFGNLFFLATAMAMVLISPGFSGMYQIGTSGIEGAFSISYQEQVVVFVVCLVLAVAVGIVSLRRKYAFLERAESTVTAQIGLLLLSVAGGCAFQFLLYTVADVGSLYAVRKYVPFLNTVFLIAVVRLFACVAASRIPLQNTFTLTTFRRVLAFQLTFFLCLMGVTYRLNYIRLDNLLSYEREMFLLRDLDVIGNDDGQTWVMDLYDYNRVFSYALSLGLFREPRGENSLAVLSNQVIPYPERIGTFIMTHEHSSAADPDCVLFRTKDVTVVDAQCTLEGTIDGDQSR